MTCIFPSEGIIITAASGTSGITDYYHYSPGGLHLLISVFYE